MELHERTEKCREVFSLLSEYLNLELPPDACQEMEAHIAGCPPCIEFAESLRKTVELCRRYQPAELPEPLGKNAREQLLEAYQKMLGDRGASSQEELKDC
jgi:anti-sigma factor RsiW